jgi:regulatory protein
VPENAFDVATRALRHADRSRAELEERLAQRGFSEDERTVALNRLEELGWLDDVRTAGLRAAALADRGYGDAYIRADLERRRLPVEAALSSLEGELERASRHAGRGAAWLARRGFDPEVVGSFAAAP